MGTQLLFFSMSSCIVDYDAETCDFPIENLPYGVFSTEGSEPRVGVAIGDQILDLAAVAAASLFSGEALSGNEDVFSKAVLNDFMGLGRGAWTEARETITSLLSSGDSGIDAESMLVAQADAVMHLPMKVGEFTDAYCSYHHAFKVGSMIRGPEEALKPNWLRMPIMYHGRSSTVQLSPNDVVRPWGQQKTPTSGEGTEFRPERLMDFELEMGIVIGQGNDQGKPITVKNASDHLFGLVLLNDWSARGIQIFEYAPLGPCRGKNLSTTISPWVVTFDALEPFKIPAREQDPAPHGYLVDPDHTTYDIKLEVALTTADHTTSGCAMNSGDIIGTGTISGPTREEAGCMLEISERGTNPHTLPSGEERKFLADGDTVILRGFCQGEGYRIGFGETRDKILPALPAEYWE